MIEFRVLGVPVPQGSKSRGVTKTGKQYTREAGAERLRPWRSDVAGHAEIEAQTHGCLEGPLVLDIVFRFPMTKSALKVDRVRGWMPRAKNPDTDKLLRAIGDALTAGGLIKDDNLFVDIRVRKIDVWEAWTGAVIRIGKVTQIGATLGDLVPLTPLGGLFTVGGE
jgi:Holliday junction resolvase RusA-like endonuclease